MCLTLQIGPDDPRLNMLAELWVACTKQEAFHCLRSQQQLGYIVFLTMISNIKVRNVAFILQSSTYSAQTLEARCEAFLADAQKLLLAMSDEIFQQQVRSVLTVPWSKVSRLDC